MTQPISERTRMMSLASGEIIGGKFRVERVLGKGGMGVVLEATNTTLDQRVALKLLASGANDAAAVERFANEARAAARLKSEHVARVYDVGSDPRFGPFIVMELLEGKTLGEVLADAGRVAPARAVEYIIDACEGLAEAHARGIIHQDVKPANLFLVTGGGGQPCVKLLDFGIATMRSKDPGRDGKSSGPTAGTPAYLAPEQLRRAPDIDHRADVWALGCVLHELIAGERAFRAERFTELVTKILEEPPRPLPGDVVVPPELAKVIERCLEKDPAKRFKSTGALAVALLPFARSRAHAVASKAALQVQVAGLDAIEIPSSMPPRPSESIIEIPSGPLRPATPPTFSEAPTEPALALSGRPRNAPGALQLPAPREGRDGTKKAPLRLVLLAFAIFALAAWLLLRRSPPPAPPNTAPATAPSAIAPPVTTSPTSSVPAADALPPGPLGPSPEPAESAASPRRSPQAKPAQGPPISPAKPRPSHSGAPAPSSDFEIRPTR